MAIIPRLKKILSRFASYVAGYSPNTRVTDDGYWDSLVSGGGPQDRQWKDRERDLRDGITAWRLSFLVRQIVRLQTAYVLGDGLTITSERPAVRRFINEFVDYQPYTPDGRMLPANDLYKRLRAWLDQLQLDGEIFPVLYTNPVNGQSQIRIIPAACIYHVECDKEDYEKELYYWERVPGSIEPKKWSTILTAKPDVPVMLHYNINKPIGATRGESDIQVILGWVDRYTEWLKERTKLNRIKSSLAGVELQTTGDVTKRQKEITANPPIDGKIAVTKMNQEKLIFHAANIDAEGAEPDGRALRLAIATGANIPLHFLAEGDTANRATAVEMGDPTHRFYRQRQGDIVNIAMDIISIAYQRAVQAGAYRHYDDLKLSAEVSDISRTDNQILAQAVSSLVTTITTMADRFWLDDETAIRLLFKFMGEELDDKKLSEWLKIIEEEPEPEMEPEIEEDEEELSSLKAFFPKGVKNPLDIPTSIDYDTGEALKRWNGTMPHKDLIK